MPMDDRRFDEITRLAIGSRRAVVGGVLGGVLAALLPRRNRGESVARVCQEILQACRRDSQCCAGNCARSGVCECPPGMTRIGDTAHCCRDERIFTRCPRRYICSGRLLCCAGEDLAPSFCCMGNQLCGDVCCVNGHECINGTCEYRVRPPDGGGVFARIRRA
jgi:hypothetical protein